MPHRGKITTSLDIAIDAAKLPTILKKGLVRNFRVYLLFDGGLVVQQFSRHLGSFLHRAIREEGNSCNLVLKIGDGPGGLDHNDSNNILPREYPDSFGRNDLHSF
jgi:hypothetical protein